jgi:4-hydroxy-tetrahydrodipicolinate synthase
MKREIVSSVCEIVKGRADVLAGVNGTGFQDIAENIRMLSEYPVSAFVIMPPPFSLSKRNPVKFMRQLCSLSDRSFYFYYNPAASGFTITVEEIKDVLAIPNVAGIKNSSGCMKLRKELLILKREMDFQLFEGHEWAVDEALMLGCDGIVAGQVSLSSKLFREIADAADAGNPQKAMEAQRTLIAVLEGVYGKALSTVWLGQKYALHKLGIFESYRTMMQDDSCLDDNRKNEIEKCLGKYRERLD